MSQVLQNLIAKLQAELAPASPEGRTKEQLLIGVPYEPHCVISWESSVQGMDDMCNFAGSSK